MFDNYWKLCIFKSLYSIMEIHDGKQYMTCFLTREINILN